MAYEYIVDPIANLNSGTILNDVLHGEILASPGLTDFEGIEIDGVGAGVRYIFLKTSAWSASHKSTLDALVTAHTATPLPGGTDISYQTAAVLQDPGTNEIMLTAPNPVSTNYTITLPASVGSTDQILKTTDTSGTLNWANQSNSFVQNVQHHYGARLNNQPGNDSFAVYCGKVDEGDPDSIDSIRTKSPVGYDGTLTKVSYLTETAISSTQMEIYINKVAQGSFSLSNINNNTKLGIETLNISVSEKDFIQIGHVGGTDPNRSYWIIYQEII